MAYRYPPGACKEREQIPPAFKQKKPDMWDAVSRPTDGTPRLLPPAAGAGAHKISMRVRAPCLASFPFATFYAAWSRYSEMLYAP